MKVALVLAVALVICIAIPGSNQGKGKKPKFCTGEDGNRYKRGKGYEDKEACIRYTCVYIKKGNKLKMKETKIQCTEDGAWSSWSSYSACSATCGLATKSRTRTCSDPAPANGGKPCPGLNQETTDCQLSPCGESEPGLAANVTAIEASMHFLNGSVESIENKLEALESNVESLQTSVESLQTSVESLQTSIESIRGMMTTMQSTSSKLEVNITSNMDAISSNKETITTYTEAINSNTDAISTNNDGISAIETTAAICAKIETCLADVNSTDCPSSEGGKISVVDAIKGNKEDIKALKARSNLVLVLGPDPWITVNLEDFSLISSNLSVPAPGVDFTFLRNGLYTIGKVINGKMYLCETSKKFCISYNGTGLEWKLENEMKPVTSREAPAQTFIPGDQPRWIVQAGMAHCGSCFQRDRDVWTPQSGTWKKENHSPPYPNDIGCIAAIEGKILQVGGRINAGGVVYTNRVFLDDVEVASMKETRIYHHCTMFENRVWVAGGVSGAWGVLSHLVEIYDYNTDTWTYGPSLPLKPKETDGGKLKVIHGDLYYICRDCGKIFKLINNADIYTWKAIADIPIHSGRVVEVMEINH